jgi:peroxiredoxin
MRRILSILLLGAAPAQAEPVPTALKVGDSIPNVTLRTVDNQELKLRTLVAEKPTVLIFVRGGWWPFCNAQLSSLLGSSRN